MKPTLTLLTVLLLAPLAALGAADSPEPAPKPNILWLVAEDMGVELGCYGTPEVRTLHLDRLAADGVRYTRFHATAPMCSPSRSAFQTGMYATSIGAHPQRVASEDLEPLPPGVRATVTGREAMATRIKSPARTKPPGLPGRNS